MFDVIVVGAGPAGVSCAIWLKQLGYRPVVIDKNEVCGGLQLSNPYTNTWIATSANAFGKDVAKAMHDNMLRHQVELRLGQTAQTAKLTGDTVEVLLSSGELLTAKFLVLAGGVAPKSGGIAKRLGTIIGPGVGVTQTDFKGATVAILGGGDNAFENYGMVKARGAASVTVFARTLKARPELLQQTPPEDVQVGDYVVENNVVNGQKFDKILVLYGWEASNSALLGLNVALRPDGFVSTDNDCLTTSSLVYAIGELAQRAHPCCTTAMADGVVAAKAIQRRLESEPAAKYLATVKRVFALGRKVVLPT